MYERHNEKNKSLLIHPLVYTNVILTKMTNVATQIAL